MITNEQEEAIAQRHGVSKWEVCPECGEVEMVTKAADREACVWYMHCLKCGCEWDKDVS